MKKKYRVLFNDTLIIHEFKQNSKIVDSSKSKENKYKIFLEDLYDHIKFRIRHLKYKLSLIYPF